ncbi:insulinase family protein [Acinetobacter sp. 194]|uniref:M16 family metallopeptidase n=1 Tax=Acinetobacter shaoyimingii TaxID=2715164 RepID=UPI00140AFD3D|nr:pitrilysin family protein [Acinetobacter shaoyimingii]NHB59512.1 insulinase family protein [Acinetobacter shaoyimingii]
MNKTAYFIIPFALCITALNHTAHANIEQIGEIELPLVEDQRPLKALTTLQSLKNLPKSEQYQAPFVQELPNKDHVRTLFVATNDLPIVDIQLTFNAGSARDEEMGQGLFGLSNMAAKLLTEGSDQYSAKQLANTFDALGAKFSVNAYRDMFIVRLRVVSDPNKLDAALNLMLHLLNHATFNDSGLKLVLSNTKVGQKQVQENPNRLMGIRFYRAVYGQHPYAEPTVGTQASIKKINPDLLVQFKNKFLVAQNSNIAITGKLSTIDATEIADKISTGLLQGEKPKPLKTPETKSGFSIHFIPHQASQAYVTLGHLGITHNNPDRIALEVANQMFGGGSFNSILSKELRIKRGLTYHASSGLSTTQSPGVFNMSYSTQQDQLMESLKITHQTLISFVNKPINKSLLEETKEGMLRAFPMTFSSNANINAQIASIGFYGLPTDYLNQYQQKVNALTSKDIEQVIKKYLHANDLTIVVVANTLDKQALLDMFNSHLVQPSNQILSTPELNTKPNK